MFKDIFIRLLQDRKISAYQVSKDTGISESLISNWKSGRQLPKYDSLIILADYFNVSGDYLLGRTDDPVLHESANENTHRIRAVPVPIKNKKASSSQPDEEAEAYQAIAKQYLELIVTTLNGITEIIPQPQLAYLFFHITNIVREIDYYICEIKLQGYSSTESSNPEYELLCCATEEIQEIIKLLT